MNTSTKCHVLTLATAAFAFPLSLPAQIEPCEYETPIVLDLEKDGINLGPAGVGVYFDLNSDSVADHIQWVRVGGDDGLLAMDRNGNGVVDDGSELFGSGTALLLEDRKAPNGFIALAQYDLPELGGNNDGLITPMDNIWSRLWLWVDSDANGKSIPEEMHRLDDFRLLSLPTIPKVGNRRDDAGNLFPLFGTAATSSRPAKMRVVDVFFKTIQ